MFDSQQLQGRPVLEPTSHTLLERVRFRDPAAWQRFVQLYGPIIYRWAKRAGLQSCDAADVTQEVLQRVAMHIEKYRRDNPANSFRAWLWGITRNQVRDFFRHIEQQRAIGGDTAYEQFQQVPFLPEVPDDKLPQVTRELVHRALQLIQTEFENSTWEAFLRCTVSKAPAKEVASDLGLTLAAVYKAKSRVLLRLRRELDGLLD